MAFALAKCTRTAQRPARASRGALQVCNTARVDKCKKTDIIVSPSILSANFSKLGEEVRQPAPSLASATAHPISVAHPAFGSTRLMPYSPCCAGASH